MRRFVFAFLGFSALTAPACSSDKDPPSVKYPSADSFCQARAEKECQVAAKCAAKPSDCVAARKAVCDDNASKSQVETRVYRPQQGEACVNKANEVYAKSPITPDDVKKLEEVCQKVFQGSKKKGTACTSQYECEGDLICDKSACATKVEKKAGDFCGNPGEVCATGAYCTLDSGAMKCAVKKGKGEACDEKTTPCLEALRCTSTCADRYGSGETCDPTRDECGASAPLCDASVGNKCSAGFTPAGGVPACGACKPNANPAFCGFGG